MREGSDDMKARGGWDGWGGWIGGWMGGCMGGWMGVRMEE